jgi:predicted GNAT family acetyltransferase
VTLPGVIARNHVADDFAARWSQRMNLKTLPRLSLGIHQLDRVTWPRKTSGSFRQAQSPDLEIVAELIEAFAREIHEPSTQDSHTKAREAIEQGRIFLWEDERRVVSIAGWNRKLRNGVAIGLVYTPPELRGRGYASNCVASLSQHMLDSGWKFCCLFTDLANPTSNKIYRDMGYWMICENKHVFFDSA